MKWGLALIGLIAAPALAQTYDVTQIVNVPHIESVAQVGVALRMGDDSSRPVEIGFEFPFYGQTFTSTYISSNGFINFSTNFNGCCGGSPMVSAPRNGIYAYWTDLISGTSPYVAQLTAPDGFRYFVAEWSTFEYGTNNLETFQIQLGEDGRIGLIYGPTRNSGHNISAGITGPTSSDNIEFFYGSRNQPSNMGYALMPGQPVLTVDCNATPNDPTCPPSAVSPVASFAPTPTATVTQAVEETVPTQQTVAAVVAEVQAAVASDPAPVTEAVSATVAAVEVAVTTTTATIAVASEKTTAAERLSPDQLKALLSGGSPLIIAGASTSVASSGPTVATSGGTQDASAASGSPTSASASIEPTAATAVKFDDVGIVAQAGGFGGSPMSGSAASEQREQAQSSFASSDSSVREVLIGGNVLPVATSDPVSQTRTSSFASQQNAILALNTFTGSPKTLSPEAGGSNPAALQQDVTLASLTATPEGFVGYQQTKLTDARFYPPREIYRRRKPVDAYMTMYRLLQSGDRRWEQMTETQYER